MTVYLLRGGGDPRYRYVCPRCAGLVEKVLSRVAISLLQDAGAALLRVPVEALDAPLRPPGAPQMPGPPQITTAEIATFAQRLARTADVAAAARQA